MLLERRRKAAKSSRSFALRLQRVDGPRFDAFVADILCSRLHGVAAPTVSYVSALLVRVRACICASVCVRVGIFASACGCACSSARFRVCGGPLWVHASSHVEITDGRAQRGIGSCECVLVQCGGLVCLS